MTALDIAYRTDVGTDATLHALVFLHMKPLVGDEHLLKESAHNLGEEPGDRTFYQTVHALFSVEYLFADNRQFLCRFRFLTNFALLRINIHKRKSYIRFRHDERVGSRNLRDAQCLKRCIQRNRIVEVFDGESDAVACSTDAIGERMLSERLLVFSSSIRSFSPYLHLPDKLPYKAWNPPAMYGENESEPFILFQNKRLGYIVA